MGISVAACGYEKNRKGAVGGNVSLHFYIKKYHRININKKKWRQQKWQEKK